MFKNIPGNHNYKISLNGRIVNNDNSECTLNIVNNNVKIEMYGKSRLVNLEWLGLISHYEVELPELLLGRLKDIIFTDIDQRLTKTISNKLMIIRKPIIINNYFRVIPCFTNYAISEQGIILDIKNNKIVPYDDFKSAEYITAYVYNPDKTEYRNTVVHRLVALAWVRNTDWITKPIVNHKDGLKHNCYRKNLEWVSHSENCIHAFENGLRKDNIKCMLRDIYTKDIINFNSISKAMKYLGLTTASQYRNIIFNNKRRLLKNKYEFKLSSDETPWFFQDTENIKSKGRYIVTIILDDNTIKKYYDLRDVKKDLGIWNVSNVTDLVNKIKTVYPNYKVNVEDSFIVNAVQALNIRTKEVIEANSVKEMTRKLNKSFTVIRNAVQSNRNREHQGYLYRYKTDKPWVIDENDSSKSKCILVTNLNTKEETIFPSLRSLAKHFQFDRSVIVKRLRDGTEYKNYTFKEMKKDS